ncbi:MAG: hypothetical protein J6Y17_04230 [Elusimicrobiaceae bacterium]|nr:hypothetical protein [Elusimicrobiaceae bacterium]
MMKKVLALFGVMLFCANVFALNAVALSGEGCQDQKDRFERLVDGLDKDSFIVQNILTDLVYPMAGMTDEQAQPLAVCYTSFKVKGVALVEFVRKNADISIGDVIGKEKANLLAFAARVEQLSEKAAFDQVVVKNNDLAIVDYVFENMINPMEQMSEQQAAGKVAIYKTYQVKGRPLSEFLHEQSIHLDMYAEIRLDGFANKIDPTK